jgi:hypothetical protein
MLEPGAAATPLPERMRRGVRSAAFILDEEDDGQVAVAPSPAKSRVDFSNAIALRKPSEFSSPALKRKRSANPKSKAQAKSEVEDDSDSPLSSVGSLDSEDSSGHTPVKKVRG